MASDGNPASEGLGGSPPAPWQPSGVPAPEALALPEIVIVPAHPVGDGAGKDIVFELREGADAAPVLPVFSSVRRLAEALGGAQPWVALPLRKVRELAAAGQVRTVMLDPEVQPGAWRWGHGDLEASQGGAE
ncbi:MAG TPA: SAV_915 family protein [Streptosporangiaceae bacterium]